MPRAELHTHSVESDGELEPDALAAACARHGVEVWALTDHDNCGGCRRARRAASRHGIEFIPGIEISAYLERSIHVLGYGVAPESDVIQELTARLRAAREQRMEAMLERLSELGVGVPLESVEREADGAPLSRAHLAEVLVRDGYAETHDEAFDRWIGAEAPGYVPVGWPSVPEAIGRIHAAGGAAILAHPGRYEVDETIPDWIGAGLDGLEVGHPRHSPGQENQYRALAEEHDLVATSSSDFHGWEHDSAELFGDVHLERRNLRALRGAMDRYRGGV